MERLNTGLARSIRSLISTARRASPKPCQRRNPCDAAHAAPHTSHLSDVQANRRLCDLEYRSGRDVLASVPYQWHLSTADHCNMRCIMCRISENPDEFEPFLPDHVHENIDALLPLAKTCFIYGAEPFYKFKSNGFRKFLESAECHDELSFVTTTNGLLVNERLSEIILERFSRIRISVDSPDPAVYESIRIRSNFARVQQNIEYLRDLKAKAGKGPQDAPTIHINYLVMDRTFRDIVPFVDLAHEWGVCEIRFSPLRVNFDPSLASEDIFLDAGKTREFTELMVQARLRAQDLGMEIIDRTARSAQEVLRKEDSVARIRKRNRKKGRKKDLPVCAAPWGTLWVNRRGMVRFCLQEATIGSVNNSSLLALYNNDAARKIRREFVQGDYSSCNQKKCPRGVSNLGLSTGEAPSGLAPECAQLANREVFRATRIKDQDVHVSLDGNPPGAVRKACAAAKRGWMRIS